MKLGFIVIAHDHPERAARLVKRLATEGATVALHWDRRHPVDLGERLRGELSRAERKRFIEVPRIKVQWDRWTGTNAILAGVRTLTEAEEPLDYVTLLSGADYPLRPLSQLAAFLEENAGFEHMDFGAHFARNPGRTRKIMESIGYRHFFSRLQHPRLFDLCHLLQRRFGLRRPVPAELELLHGCPWWTLSWSTVQRMAQDAARPAIRRFARHSWLPSETVPHALVRGAADPSKISQRSLGFCHLGARGRPIVFHLDRFAFLAAQPHFFARKISPRNTALQDRLDELADSRRGEPAPKLPLEKNLTDYMLHRYSARSSFRTRRILGREPSDDLGALGANRRDYTVLVYPPEAHLPDAGENGTQKSPGNYGELFAPDAIDYAGGPPHPLYPAWAVDWRDGDPAAFLADLLQRQSQDTARMQFRLRLPCHERVARLLAMDPHCQVRLCGEPSHSPTEKLGSTSGTVADIQTMLQLCHTSGKRANFETARAEEHKKTKAGHRISLDHILRFGDYFVCSGSLPANLGEHELTPAAFTYEFPGVAKQVQPEFAFHGRPATSGPGLLDGKANSESHPTTSFFHTLWIRGGAKLVFKPDQSILLRFESAAPGALLAGKVSNADGPRFIGLLRHCATSEAWVSRQVLEIAALPAFWAGQPYGLDAASRLAFSAELLLRTGRISDEFAPPAPVKNLRMSQHLVIRACYGYDRLPPILRATPYDPQGPLEDELLDPLLCLTNLENIVACGHWDKGLVLAGKIIEASGGDRRQIARVVHALCPAHSKWWLAGALEGHGYLGAEQSSDALGMVAGAVAEQGQAELAALLYDAALAIDPDAQSVALSAGWLALERGSIDEAAGYFERITRHGAMHSLAANWPRFNGVRWPLCPLPKRLFRGVDDDSTTVIWPRITVITPSLNQGRFIEERILSVLNQNYPNLQYIVVDGGSNDQTRRILDRYADRIDQLIIEPDSGQACAINKGLALADGQLVAWLNSDDMYAPGALHIAAREWIKHKPDILAGICAEHSNGRFGTINKPKAKSGDFTMHSLSLVVERWFAGWFFYQPEVFFTRSLLQKSGPLDERLTYTMDYVLWMRFAQLEAELRIVAWPFAFFRRHQAQKTQQLRDVLREQQAVRDRYRTSQSAHSGSESLFEEYKRKQAHKQRASTALRGMIAH